MHSQNASLKRSVVQTAALKLEAEFGSSDRERLQKLIDLIGEDHTLAYHLALQAIAPDKNEKAAQPICARSGRVWR